MEQIAQKNTEYHQSKKASTWRTVLEFIHEMGFDEDEYFHLFVDKHDFIDKPVWRKQQWISVFWVVGGSEGYYVHVENRWNNATGCHADLILLGKFWDWQRAQEVARAVQQFVNFL